MNILAASRTMPVTDFKKNPTQSVRKADNHPIAILNNNKAEFYAVPAPLYEAQVARSKELEALVEVLFERLEDGQDQEMVRERVTDGSERIFVTLNDLAK